MLAANPIALNTTRHNFETKHAKRREEEIGLTKLPKLAKKTWADIASESNDDSETDLQALIQNTKQSKKIVNQKRKQTLSQPKTPPSKPTNSYIYKNKFSIVFCRWN